MKKQIIICMTSMHLGGAERSLIGLLQAFDYSKINVDLFLNQHVGELLNDIPTQVNLLPENSKYASITKPVIQILKKGHFLIAFFRLISKLFVKAFYPRCGKLAGTTTYIYKFTKWLMPKICPQKTYDIAISYITPHYFAAEKIKAKKRIAWIHQDYRKGVFGYKEHLKMWSKYDSIVSISDLVKEGFVSCFPSLSSRIVSIENIIPVDLIRKYAAQQMDLPYNPNCINILSIGRFCWEKNFTSIPVITKKLVEMGLDIYWYIIGFGGLENEIKSAILDEGMQERVVLIGKINNPYPYIKGCSLYVQPSLSEGKAVTVLEAQILCKPVIITNYPTAKSQLKDGYDGIISPLGNEECANAIKNLIENPDMIMHLTNNCRASDYSGKKYLSLLLDEEI